MIDLRKLSDDLLEQETQTAAADERAAITRILNYLRELDRRRIPALRGFSSLDEYCVKVLKYSKGSAYRRVSAMRMLRELPSLRIEN